MSTSLHVLAGAVEERRDAVMRCGSDAGEREIRIQFLADGRSGGASGFWAELSGADASLTDRLIARQTPVHVSFTSGHRRMHFETTILQRQRLFRRGERVLLAWPAALRVAERRRAGRLPVGEQTSIVARLRAAENLPDIPLQIRDLDARGASFVLDAVHLPESADDALHICMNFAGVDHWVVAMRRNLHAQPDGRVRLGVEFDRAQSAALQSGEWFARAMDDIRACRTPQAAENAA